MRQFYLVLLGCIFGYSLSAQFTLGGQAVSLGGDCYRLTQSPSSFALGTAWSTNTVNLNQPFDLRFEIKLGCKDANGADGMVFGLQALSNTAGSPGGGMGFGNVSPSIGIEFDTYENAVVGDPAYDHSAIIINGDVDHLSTNTLAGPVQTSATSINIEDCNYHEARITWDPTTSNLKMYFNCVLRLNYSFPSNPITTIFNGNPNVFWGFTSSTGGYDNNHEFCLYNNPFTGSSKTATICRGDSALLTFTGGTTYRWNTSNGLSDSTSASPYFFPLSSAQYIVEITDLCGDTWYDTANILVEEPHAVNLGTDTVICSGDSIVLDANDSSGVSYLWNTNQVTPTITATAGGTYTVTATKGLCQTVESININPLALPTLNLGTDSVLCPGESISLTASAPSGTTQWSTGSTASSIQVNQPGLYTVEASNICGTIKDSIQIMEEFLPTLDLGPKQVICPGEEAVFDGTGTHVDTRLWSNGSTNPILRLDSSTSLTLTVTNACGSVTDTAVVDAIGPPAVALPRDTVLCVGQGYKLQPTMRYVSSFVWLNGSTDSAYSVTRPDSLWLIARNVCDTLTFTTVVSEVRKAALHILADDSICAVELSLAEASTVGFTAYRWSNGDKNNFTLLPIGNHFLEALDTNGCIASENIRISEYCPERLFAPNAFTPNGDGQNDVFTVSGLNLFQPKLSIYDRWGGLVYQGEDTDAYWDGTANGELAQEGYYIWRFSYQSGDGSAQTEMGSVLLLLRD